MRKLITVLIVTLAAISCGKIKDAHNTLNDIETFINERPDSALTILDSFDTSLLDNKSVWAHHSLLHAQAKDKCYIDETDDSLMTQVVNYYEWKRDKEKLFKAYYYLGRIQYNAGNYTESIISYIRAEELIDFLADDFSKGLLYAQLGMLHMKYYDYQNSLDCFDMAQEYYQKSNNIAHQYFTKLNMGHIYHEMREYELAESLFMEVLTWSYDNHYYAVCQEAIELLITLYDETNRIYDSISLIESEFGQICSNSLPLVQTRAYQMAIDGSGNALDYLNKESKDLLNSFADTLNTHYYEYCIHKIAGNYYEALQIHEKLRFIQDTLELASFRQSLLASLNSHLKIQNNLMGLKLKATKSRNTILIVIALLIMMMIALYTFHKIHKQKREMIHYIEAADELEKILEQKILEIESISNRLGLTDLKLQKSSEYISGILGKQFGLLNKLTNTYYETHGCRKDMEAIYKEVSKEIEKLSSDKATIQHLEDMVNLHKENAMEIIRDKLPMLHEMDYRLMCYWCIGFSAKAISIFTGDSTNNIYVKKSRIKNEILKLDNPTKDFIISAIYSNYIH